MGSDTRMKQQQQSSYLYAANAPFIEELYSAYLNNPADIDEHWRQYFDQLRMLSGHGHADVDHSVIRKSFAFQARQPRQLTEKHFSNVIAAVESKQVSVLQLINAFRFRGHQEADVDPLRLHKSPPIPDLNPAFHRLTEADMSAVFNTGSLVGPEQATLAEIVEHLTATYCGHMGAEYMHLTSTSQKRWIQERLEATRSRARFTPEVRRQILERVMAAESLEKYLHTKYVGQKRFSLEGGESLIPLLDALIQRAGAQGIKEFVLGMAHRGRLNVLTNILGKSPQLLFQEFEGKFDPSTNQGSGDVKYHQGFSTDLDTPGGPIHLALAFNPSHLEIVDPVVEGSVRARQQRRRDTNGKQVLPVVIHGDAAFAGQGVVMETFNMSNARGFRTGGTIHIIINNQIGFTTSNPLDARSTQYCTEVARMVQAPVFHVNGDDPEAVVYAIQLAVDFRMVFGIDVVVDLVCYRRHGHSEADEPAATQPMMYKKIRSHATVPQVYAGRLTDEGVISSDHLRRIETAYREKLDQGEVVAPHVLTGIKNEYIVDWTPYRNTDWTYPVNTNVSRDVIRDMAKRLAQLPEGFELHPRVAKIFGERTAMSEGEMRLDWGFSETMAYATLLRDGYSVRLSGQDSGRGTFFHRHAVLHNQADGGSHVPLQHLFDGQPSFTAIDSLLSEEAVLGFEYGFSAAEPKSLVIWEAQFGDFANNAQVVIDQFISSGEAKWGRLSGLVMLLPHGYDGQGPEHSSARLERYLQLCAEDNIQVCFPTLPSQMFHMLRRQMLRPYRKPLIVMSPKSLLRHKLSTSALDELESGGFQPVIGEIDSLDPNTVSRVVVCSGKVYFDLLQARRDAGRADVAIIRLEQLYPFPAADLSQQLERYSSAKEVVWCQEEPENQGGWFFVERRLRECLSPKQRLEFVGRPASASPAVGYLVIHNEQQRQVVEIALGD